jgi:hypothetical protein
MRHPLTTCLPTAVLVMVTAGWALGQDDIDRGAMCADTLAEKLGVDASAIAAAPADEIADVMVVTLELEGATWICTLDDAGGIAELTPKGE